MRTITINLYKYNELSDAAKQKAREWFLTDYPHHGWWEAVYDDAKNVGVEITGFDLDRNTCEVFMESVAATIDAIIDQHGAECGTYKCAVRYKTEYELLLRGGDGEVDMDSEEYTTWRRDFTTSLRILYRDELQNEYDWLNREERVAEVIIANEYEFLESGEQP